MGALFEILVLLFSQHTIDEDGVSVEDVESNDSLNEVENAKTPSSTFPGDHQEIQRSHNEDQDSIEEYRESINDESDYTI